MKRPAWATIVGILAIIFGLLGLIGSAQTAMMPKLAESQKTFFDDISSKAKPAQQAQMEEVKAAMNKMFGNVPPWAGRACLILAGLGAVVNAVYIFAAINLLQMKPYSVKLFYRVIGASVFLAITRGVILSQAFSMMGANMAIGAGIGALLDLVLVAVVATRDKQAFVAGPVPA